MKKIRKSANLPKALADKISQTTLRANTNPGLLKGCTLYLYGSCARGDAGYMSDIDILAVVPDELSDMEICRNYKPELYAFLEDGKPGEPEIDLHIISKHKWDSGDSQFIRNVKKENIKLYG